MECLHCKGRMERASAPLSIDRKGYHVSWDAVAAWVCQQCGEVYFEPDEVKRLQQALTVLDHEATQLARSGT
ncbi:MAG: YgiT-type zinc finger protein [Planctomycetaceae bacterium]